MARVFNIPGFYKSSVVSTIKEVRREQDRRKEDLVPSIIDLGKLKFKIARHFGFCFGVENAIEIAYRALDENPDKRVFLLSEMIHNPRVNGDLISRGVKFLMSPQGEQLIPFDELDSDDIVIVPAFGTTVELFDKLHSLGINPQEYNATCPFVERVWKRAGELGEKGFTIVIHGKHDHEETRATFSHARLTGPSIVIRDLEQAELLSEYLKKEKSLDTFFDDFGGLTSEGFDPKVDLDRIGVVNQTTMLATETQEISDLLKESIVSYFGESNWKEHFADTRDTLCYATTENQEAITGLLSSGGDIALVVGGYNSSNTSHLVELLEEHVPTFYIKGGEEVISLEEIQHLDLSTEKLTKSSNWIPKELDTIEILITAGASCPDALVDEVIVAVTELFGLEGEIEGALSPYLVQIGQQNELVR